MMEAEHQNDLPNAEGLLTVAEDVEEDEDTVPFLYIISKSNVVQKLYAYRNGNRCRSASGNWGTGRNIGSHRHQLGNIRKKRFALRET